MFNVALQSLVDLMGKFGGAQAERPVLYVGGGCLDAAPELRSFVRRTGVPVASTLMGLGTFPESHDLYLGMLGMHGTYAANYAIHNADLLLALGVRFDDRVTGRQPHTAPSPQSSLSLPCCWLRRLQASTASTCEKCSSCHLTSALRLSRIFSISATSGRIACRLDLVSLFSPFLSSACFCTCTVACLMSFLSSAGVLHKRHKGQPIAVHC